ncbi:Red1p [Saccharomyces eubayanus]|uniref:Red1p n=1 Tax=Saccharomyces eubayanus TaxID=1080349 RepID=UPI0006C2F650|nr:RED1-like protein [Saccharomyces eubayanus]KOG97952.1 RED1-like protein [Saccharomyces eubayanus]
MEGLKRKIFGVCLKNDYAEARNETKGIHYSLINMDASEELEELLSLLLRKGEIIRNFELLFHIINFAVKITDSNLPNDNIWRSILKLRYSSEIEVEEDSKVLKYLIKTGISIESPISWKCLAVVSCILDCVPRSKRVISKLIEMEYANSIGQLFDNIQDLQQGNFLVEILSNCFVKSAPNGKNVERIPQLWPTRSKNKLFFENKFYPFRSRNGNSQTCLFLCNNFMSSLSSTGILKQVSYSGSEALKNLRVFKKREECGNSFYFIQCIYNKLYLWLDEKVLLEFERKSIKIIKNLKNKIQIKLKHPFHECANTTADDIAILFNKVRGFQLEFEDNKSGEAFFHKVNNVPKISEVQKFLVLDYIEEEPEDEDEEEENLGRAGLQREGEEEESLDELSTSMSFPIKSSVPHNRNEKVQLATPDRSISIRSDEWDLKSNTEDEGNDVAIPNLKINTSKEGKKEDDFVQIDSEEQSPIVSAQIRKMRRESTKTLEILRQDFEDREVENRDDSPEQLHSPFVNPSSLIVGKSSIVEHREKLDFAHKVTETTKLKSNGSIKKRDINVLDTIFGLPPPKRPKQSNKKDNKQQKTLTNFKPIIDVPSQDKRILRSNAPSKPKSIKKSKLRVSKKAVDKKSTEPDTETGKLDKLPASTEDGKTVIEIAKKKDSAINEEHDNPQEKGSPGINESKEITQNDSKITPEPRINDTFLKSSVIENRTPESKECNITNILESTTVVDLFSPHESSASGQNSFTNKLQEQIYKSINHFSNELVRKISIINQELNIRILKELSEKYQKLFSELQDSFQNDTNEMLKFVGEIKGMINLPEEQLIHAIRTRKFNDNGNK